LFQPFLYQVATAGLSPGDIAAPIRSLLRRQRNTTVLLAEAEAVDLQQRHICLTDGVQISYDYLILATGARHAYFGHDEWEPYAPGLKNIEDALEIRRRMLLAFEAAEREPELAKRQALLTFVVIGGGPTGVEMAGAMAEVARQTITRDFRRVDPSLTRVLLVEAGLRILGTFPEDLAARALQDLTHLGVEVRTNTPVTAIEREVVVTKTDRIQSYTAIWAAGVAASPLARTLGVPLDKAGRVMVEADLSIKDHPEIFVVGDLATLVDAKTGKPLPGVATVAIQQGRAAADNIRRLCQGSPSLIFHYRERGSMATIGRARAIVDLGWVKLTGLMAWLTWVVVHIYFLIGFEDRLLVMIQWAWAYVTQQRGNRLITYDRTRPPVVSADLAVSRAVEPQFPDGRWSEKAHNQ